MLSKVLIIAISLLMKIETEAGSISKSFDMNFQPTYSDQEKSSDGDKAVFLKKITKKAKKKKTKTKVKEDSNACKPPKENLIVVNFSPAKLTLYVNEKKTATVKALDQFSFKYVLPVGETKVQLLNAARELVREELFNVLSQGKQTCKKNRVIIVK